MLFTHLNPLRDLRNIQMKYQLNRSWNYKLMKLTNEDSPNEYEETRNDIRCPSINTSINSINSADRLGELVTSNTVEPACKRQKTNSVNSDRETDDGISYNVDNDNEFRQQENILKLTILRVQLDREEKETQNQNETRKTQAEHIKIAITERKSAFLEICP